MHRWTPPSGEAVPPLPEFDFSHCRLGNYRPHYTDCLYWLWPLACCRHWKNLDQITGDITMPWGRFSAFNVVRRWAVGLSGMMAATMALPERYYTPAVFAIFPITHLEIVKYVPEGAEVGSAGMPIVIMDE